MKLISIALMILMICIPLFATDLQADTQYKYVASVKSKVFHKIGCTHEKRIKCEKVYFETREEAIASGRRPCKKCSP